MQEEDKLYLMLCIAFQIGPINMNLFMLTVKGPLSPRELSSGTQPIVKVA